MNAVVLIASPLFRVMIFRAAHIGTARTFGDGIFINFVNIVLCDIGDISEFGHILHRFLINCYQCFLRFALTM